MKRAELKQVVQNVLDRCGVKDHNTPGSLNVRNLLVDASLPEAAATAAGMAFIRCLTEDDDTRKLRWQYGDLVDKGTFTLED